MEQMKHVLRLVALGLLLLGAASTWSQSNDAPGSAPAPVPQPDSLNADWWRYFSETGEDLHSRAARAQEHLDAILISLTRIGEPHDTIRALTIELSQIIEQFVDASGRAPPTAPAPEVTEETYTIARYLDLVARQREQRFELELESDELERETRSLAGADKEIKNMLTAYLALAPGVPERAPDGLRLMRARLLWGIGMEDLRIRRVRVEQLQVATTHTADVATQAEGRLSVTEKAVEDWKARHTAAEEELRDISAEASASRLQGTLFPEDARGAARKRHHAQRLLNYEARILFARVQAARAALAAALGEYLLGATQQRVDTLRAARRNLNELLGPIPGQAKTFRQATDRERAAAERLLTEADDKAFGFTGLHRTRIRSADETVQNLNRLSRELDQSSALLGVVSRLLVESEGKAADLLARGKE